MLVMYFKYMCVHDVHDVHAAPVSVCCVNVCVCII